MKFKSTIITLLFILAVGLSIGSVFFAGSKNQLTASVTDKDQIDTLVEDVVTTVFDKNGKVSLKIVTPKMIHYTKSDLTLITTPKITIFREPDNIWHVDAESAEAFNGLDKIIFRRNVVVSHKSDAGHPVTMLYTSLLTVHPEDQTAETNQAVSILQPGAKANAIGMFANLQDGTVKLLSDAREEYVPS
jgi:lipopolysaccharide export system protein LptC